MTSSDLDRVSVQKYLYLFLWTIATTADLNGVFFAESNVRHLLMVLELLYQGAADATDLAIQRTSFATVTALVGKWMENASLDPKSKQAAVEFIVTQFSTAAFGIAKQKQFNFKDAQSSLLVKEVVRLQQTLLKFGGADYAQHLQRSVLPPMGASADAIVTSKEGALRIRRPDAAKIPVLELSRL